MKKYWKIWLTTVVITLIVGALYRIAASYVVENWVIQNGGDLIAPQYLARFAQLTEKRFAGTMDEVGENQMVSTSEDLWKMYYQTVNDKVCPGGFLTERFHVYDLATVMWIADMDGNIVLRGDYAVFRQYKKYALVDLADCFSEEDLQKLTRMQLETFLFGINDRIEMTEYVVKDDICYPLTLVVTREDGEVITFEGSPNFDVTAYEIVTDDSYVWEDEKQDSTDPNYQEIKQYTKSILARRTAGKKFESAQIGGTNWGKRKDKYLKVTEYVLNDGEYLLCKGEISNYGHFLRRVTFLGWGVICVIALLLTAMITFFRQKKYQKAEYERAVTNALAHDYKSSLMIQRGYAENLLSGVSEEKKHLYEQKIIEEIDKMDLRTERLLSMFRASAGGNLMKEEEIDVEELCRELITNYEELSGKRGLTWKFGEEENAEQESPKERGVFCIKADKMLLSMALDNLINNACKYSLQNSQILLVFAKDSMIIENKWKPIGKFLKKPKLLWEPYVTGEEAGSSRNSGIGLSTTRQILKRMRLKLAVRVDEYKIQFTIQR